MCQDCPESLTDHPELALLLSLSAAVLASEEAHRIRRILQAHRETLDWGRFLHLAARHRLLPLSGRNLITYGLTVDGERRPLTPYRQVFAGAYLGNRARNCVLHAEYGRVLRALNDSGLPYLVRKGPALDVLAFADLGARQSTDLDLLIDRSELTRFADKVGEVGYAQGKLRPDGTVEPYSRRAQIYWATRLNNSLPYVKAGGTIEVDHFKLDACHALSQRASAALIPNDDLFGRSVAVQIGGVRARTLSDIDHLLDQCLHLYKEATALYFLEGGKGLKLRQLVDVRTLTGGWKPSHWDEFVRRAQAYDAVAEIYYTLYFTAMAYPTAVPARILEVLRPADEAYLDQYGNFDGHPTDWKHPFFERLLLDLPVEGATSVVPRG